MTNQLPLVTIIVAVFNAEKTLQQCLDSIANQSYSNRQLVVIDGGSTDTTLNIIMANQGQIDYYISEKDRGIYHAWNKGLDQALGEWICFLGSDDYFYSNHVVKNMMSKILNEVPDNFQIVYGRVALISEKGDLVETLGEEWTSIRENFKNVMCIPHPGVFHRKSLFEQNGKFDERFRIAGDYEMLLRVLKTEDAYSVMDMTLVAMRMGGVSSVSHNTIKSLLEMRLAQKIHGQRIINKLIFKRIVKEYLRNFICRLIGEENTRKVLNIFGQFRSRNRT